PLLARAALPRFVRPGDRFEAGVVVNSRMPGATDVSVEAEARGIRLRGDGSREESVSALAPRDVRFGFEATEGDSARFGFVVRGGGQADGVEVGVPVRPRAHPLVRTLAGLLHDSATVAFPLGEEIDPERSWLEVSFGSSPLAYVAGARQRLRLYPYYCSEQVSSVALPLIALYRARVRTGGGSGSEEEERWRAGAREDVQRALRLLLRRQGADGGIGYWDFDDWTTPTLTAWAGRVLLEAREAGFAVPDSALAGVAGYLERSLHEAMTARFAVWTRWADERARLAERLAAIDLLSRLGRPDVPAEHSLLQRAYDLRWEDRVLLAQALARRGETAPAWRLLEVALRGARVDGRVLALPDSAGAGVYFASRGRPAARLLETLLLLDPDHPMVGPTVEYLVARGRADLRRWWSTFDEGHTVLALMRYDDLLRERGPVGVTVRAPEGRLELTAGAGTADTVVSLAGLGRGAGGGLPLTLHSEDGRPVFYYLTLSGMPRAEHPEPVDRGIAVERWYEDVETGRPVVEAEEGELLRVRLRITVPSERTFVVVDDPLPAGLEAVDLSLRTVSPFGAWRSSLEEARDPSGAWAFGAWDSGMWTPFDHKEMRDERVVYSATVLWPGTYGATYLARATTAGVFLYPPAHAEEMYNPGVNGRSGGGTFTVRRAGR
ncbi:MAG TPA: hypothetical protein VE173_00510, partial [Longimicrobiales bacterium]|nr:hypothetical protein [Longimicrobiales bacterium]